MRRAVDQSWLKTDVFQNVNLTAIRPAYRCDIHAQRPKRRPDTLTTGNFDPRFNAAIRPRCLALCLQPRRSVTAAHVTFLARFDHELAILDTGVVRARRVVFEFAIAPPAPARVVTPFGRIGRAAIRLSKLISPD